MSAYRDAADSSSPARRFPRLAEEVPRHRNIEARLKAIAKEEQFMSVTTHFDEELQSGCAFVNSQGTPHSISWALISSPE